MSATVLPREKDTHTHTHTHTHTQRERERERERERPVVMSARVLRTSVHLSSVRSHFSNFAPAYRNKSVREDPRQRIRETERERDRERQRERERERERDTRRSFCCSAASNLACASSHCSHAKWLHRRTSVFTV